MSSKSKGSSTNVDIDLDQKFDIDYENKRENVDKDYSTTHTYNNNSNVDHEYTNIDVDAKIIGTGYVKLEDIETTKTETVTHNYNQNTTTYTDSVSLDVSKHVYEKITVDQTLTENWDVNVHVYSDNIIQNSHILHDEDVNDLDTKDLINVENYGELHMDDFTLDVTSIGESFNGPGNDGQVSISQSNNLDDSDRVSNTSATYNNHQAPNIDGSLGVAASIWGAESASYGSHVDQTAHTDTTTVYDKYGNPVVSYEDGKTYTTGSTYGSHAASAGASGSLYVDLKLSAPNKAFETVEAKGGSASAGDGIGYAHLTNANSDNEGSGVVSGDALASADATATAASFNNEILAGGNQQLNLASVNLVGGDNLDAGDISGGYKPGDHDPKASSSEEPDSDHEYPAEDDGGLAIKDSYIDYDDDINDLDTNDLINVDDGKLYMDDFDLDINAIGNSFNGPGNDWAFDVNQTNDLVDNDTVSGTVASYYGAGWNAPFQSVTATGGWSTAGDGVGSINGSGVANSNGGDGAILGSTAATADALASATAFTNSIVVGANIQGNSFAANIVGGDQTIVDDITGSL